ncbi:16262_t:CDS:2, partial [Gigaspora margarita]
SSSESEKDNVIANTSNLQLSTNKKKKKTKPFGEVWNYFKKGIQKSNGHYKAISQINRGIDNNLDNADHLTLEYLISLKNYSAQSHTSEFLISEILDVDRLGSDRFAAVVTDAAIWNIRCVVHVINLIAAALVKLDNIKRLIRKGLKDNGFHDAALTALELWQNLGHTRLESEELIVQMRRFEAKIPPFDLSYVPGTDTPKIWWGSFKNKPRHLAELAHRIFSINPTQSNCERNFSTLKWILRKH